MTGCDTKQTVAILTAPQSGGTAPLFHWCYVSMDFGSQSYTICHPPYNLCFRCYSPSASFLFSFLFPSLCFLLLFQYHSSSLLQPSCFFFPLHTSFSFPLIRPGSRARIKMLCYMHSPSVSCPLLPTSSVSETKAYRWTYCARGSEPLSAFFAVLVWVAIHNAGLNTALSGTSINADKGAFSRCNEQQYQRLFFFFIVIFCISSVWLYNYFLWLAWNSHMLMTLRVCLLVYTQVVCCTFSQKDKCTFPDD